LRFAILALAAPGIGHHDVVAGLELCDSSADCAHDAGTFVAEHLGKFGRIVGVTAMHVGRAHAAGHDFDQQLVAARIAEIELLDVERAGALMHHGSGDLHERSWCYSAASADSDKRAIASARSS